MAAREEDKAMAGLLRRSLARDAGAGSGENCPEPEILAAYFDHSLDAQETARYDLHFSRCSACREQLAAMVRAGGASDTDAAEKKTASAWDWLTGPRWLMPAAAMLVALLAITGIALRMRTPAVPTNEVAMARPGALPPANPAPPTISAPSPEAAPSSGATSPAPPAADELALRPSAPTQSSASRELGPQSPSRVIERAHTSTRGSALPRVGAVGGGLAGKSATAPVMQPQAQKPAPPQASTGMVRGAMRARSGGNSSSAPGGAAASGSGGGVGGGVAKSADETETVTEAAPVLDAAEPSKVLPRKRAETDSYKSDAQVSVGAETAPQPNARKSKKAATAPAPAAGVSAMNLATNKTTEAAELAKMQQAQISSNLMNLQIQTPDPKILWTIAAPDAIKKSDDGGTTWKLEYLETRARIIAGSAPSAKICWLVGETGTILRTTNGSHWKTIKPPADTDFLRVEAADALTATVTALDGRRFSTSDGGKSWSSVK